MTDLVTPAHGVQLRGLRRSEYELLAEAGVFAGERVELIGGEVVRMSPQHELHSWAIMRLNAQLATLMQQGYEVRVQLPLAVDDVSLPEPDVAVTERQHSRVERPTTALAVVEVALSSQSMDLVHKASRYAAAGVPLYVVLDLVDGVAVAHRRPHGAAYEAIERLGPDDALDILGTRLDLAELLGA